MEEPTGHGASGTPEADGEPEDESAESLLGDPAVQNSFAVAPITSSIVLILGKVAHSGKAWWRRHRTARE